ncbi:MAG: hypothetical protein JW734_02195 [Candidatus Omnitrophica bacterium]|nr:hypothetical protein [Candidatus Omnitrophota bacterium]
MNIFLLGLSCIAILRKRHILNFLLGFCFLSLALLELGKLSFLLGAVFIERLLGAGFFLLALFWLIFSSSLLGAKSRLLKRGIMFPVLGLASLLFFVIWWIKPFMFLPEGFQSGPQISGLAQYFFMLFILDLSFSLSNLERSLRSLRQKKIQQLLMSSLFMLIPYILLATYAVLFSEINPKILAFSSLGVFIGGLMFTWAVRKKISFDNIKEETAVQSSMVLVLAGGYLFFIGAFVKFFKVFGWSLQSVFSSLTTLFIFFALLFIVFSSSFKKRLKNFILRNFSRQKYDWQKVWEDFTYKISLVTDTEQIKTNIEEAISNIFKVKDVEVFIFERQAPFEENFGDWLLRRADVFTFGEVFENGFSQKYPQAFKFFKDKNVEIATPLYGEGRVIGLIHLKPANGGLDFFDKDLFKVLALQVSSVIVNCRANQALREVEKKDSITKVSTFVMHDVKNYVNNLSLLVANKDKFSKPDFQEDAFFTLETTIEKMKRLIDEFKTLRGDLRIEKRRCGLNYIIDEALRDLGENRLVNIEHKKVLREGLLIDADAHYIHKVIFNILLNAIEAMKGKGLLYLRTGVIEGKAYIFIKDSGCGMSGEFIETKLFKPFSSTKKKGLGIGLYQCKTIIEAHGGSIEAESREGEGTVFKVLLPLAKTEDKLASSTSCELTS